MKIREEIITARTNPTVKWACTLAEKKGRSEAGAFMAEGEKLTFEAIKSALPITHVLVEESKKERLLPMLRAAMSTDAFKNTEILFLSESAFSKISTEKAPQGIISIIKHLDFFFNMDIIYKEEFFLEESERALALCSVRDPGNLGSVIRSAVAFGVDHLVLSEDCADVYNPKTVRSAMGSLFKVKISYVKDFGSFISSARANGRRVFAAELSEGAASLSDIDLCSTDVLIIGNEGHGIPKDVSEKCDKSVYIPISDKTESLNASVAAAVFMWEQKKLG